MAQAQLVGWLEGLFHGIQATLVAQQMAARQQLEGMRGQLPEMEPAARARRPVPATSEPSAPPRCACGRPRGSVNARDTRNHIAVIRSGS